MNTQDKPTALETLVSARDALKALTESGYIPFASPRPCSNEVNIKTAVHMAIKCLNAAIWFHEKQFGKN